MLKKIRELAKSFLEKSKDKEVLIISHNDTDGITSAAILAKTLQKLDKPFTLKIIKNLEEEIIKILPKDKIIIFLDLASNSLNKIKRAGLKDVFILDHHEITQEVPEGIEIANPHLENKKESLSGSCLTYLFSKEINKKDRSLARLAIIGMVGDLVEKDLTDLKNKILQDSEAVVKKSLLIYPATRPINKTLEYNSSIYLPGVTGSAAGASRFVMDTGIKKQGNKFKSLIELNEDEMKKLVTAIHLIINPTDEKNLIGNLFLVKFFNKIEDCREISALINACSRSGESGIAVALCLGNQQALKKARSIHAKYRREITSALNEVSTIQKIKGKDFVIMNARDKVKDTIIGTVTSIISHSRIYKEGTVIVGMAYSQEKIKISARLCGENGRNVKEVLARVHSVIEGEIGGHSCAAGSLIKKEQEEKFIEQLKKVLELEVIKINQ